MLTSAAFGLFPYLLPSNADPSLFGPFTTQPPPVRPRYRDDLVIPHVAGVRLFPYTYRNFSGKVTPGKKALSNWSERFVLEFVPEQNPAKFLILRKKKIKLDAPLGKDYVPSIPVFTVYLLRALRA